MPQGCVFLPCLTWHSKQWTDTLSSAISRYAYLCVIRLAPQVEASTGWMAWCTTDISPFHVFFKHILPIGVLNISCEIALRRVSQNLIDDKTSLVQVMAWCLMAPSHCLSQCWPRLMSLYGITRPQWVNVMGHIMQASCTLFFTRTYFFLKYSYEHLVT